jgi:biopolymer transport protein TolR
MARRARKAINQMNVVPYIDVMLVLLIIFMVTAPLINPGTIDLPSVGKDLAQPKAPPIEITVKLDKTLWIRDLATGEAQRKVTREELIRRIHDKQQQSAEQSVVIAADRAIRYEEVIGLIDLLQQNKIARVGLLARTGTPGQ